VARVGGTVSRFEHELGSGSGLAARRCDPQGHAWTLGTYHPWAPA
jgi:hypothetical protein